MELNSGIFQETLFASKQNIIETLEKLPGTENPFMILGQNDLIYIQTLNVEGGFILEYQDGSLKKHYRSKKILDIVTVQTAFLQYHDGIEEWKTDIEFEKVDMRDFWYQLGKIVGKILRIPKDFIIGLKKGYKESRSRKQS